jgi:hypothetical protein
MCHIDLFKESDYLCQRPRNFGPTQKARRCIRLSQSSTILALGPMHNLFQCICERQGNRVFAPQVIVADLILNSTFGHISTGWQPIPRLVYSTLRQSCPPMGYMLELLYHASSTQPQLVSNLVGLFVSTVLGALCQRLGDPGDLGDFPTQAGRKSR